MRNILTLCFLVMFISSACLADVVVTIETNESGASKSTGKMFVQGKKLRMMQDDANKDGHMIFRGDKKMMMTIDPDEKEFVQITKGDMQKIASKMNSAMSQLEAQMANVPPQQRAMMEQMMGGMLAKMKQQKKAPAVVKKTSETQDISGYKCQKYEVTRDGKKTREYWVASSGALAAGGELKSAFTEMGSFFEELISAISKGPMADMIDNPYSEFAKINGVPIKTVQYKNGKVERETLIKTIAKEKIELAMFEPPAGYTRRSVTEGL